MEEQSGKADADTVIYSRFLFGRPCTHYLISLACTGGVQANSSRAQGVKFVVRVGMQLCSVLLEMGRMCRNVADMGVCWWLKLLNGALESTLIQVPISVANDDKSIEWYVQKTIKI